MTLSYPAFSTTVFLPKTPNALLDLAVQITQGGPQLITATPGMGGGTVTLVSPSKISIDTNAGNLGQRRTVSFSKLTLSFIPDAPVPEPSTLLLLAGAVLALGRFGRRESR